MAQRGSDIGRIGVVPIRVGPVRPDTLGAVWAINGYGSRFGFWP